VWWPGHRLQRFKFWSQGIAMIGIRRHRRRGRRLALTNPEINPSNVTVASRRKEEEAVESAVGRRPFAAASESAVRLPPLPPVARAREPDAVSVGLG
jgi:hypothetical protein